MSGKYILQLNLQHVELEQNYFREKPKLHYIIQLYRHENEKLELQNIT